MANRDWHTDPLQGSGRSAYYYGRTGPVENDLNKPSWVLRGIVIAAPLALALWAGIYGLAHVL